MHQSRGAAGSRRARTGGPALVVRVTVVATAAAALLGAGNVGGGPSGAAAGAAPATAVPAFTARSLDGSGNNTAHPSWGKAGTNYARVAHASYTDGIAKMAGGPNARYVSNRIFNDVGQNLFSENNISQWGWAWGQFLDHDMGLRNENPGSDASVPFDATDPLESFTNDTGSIAFNRTPAAPGTGVGNDAPAGQHAQQLHRRVERLRRQRGAARLAAQRPGRRQPERQQRNTPAPQRLPPAAQPRAATRRPHRRWISWAAWPERPTSPWSPATCARTRTSRSPRSRRCSRESTTASSTRCRSR